MDLTYYIKFGTDNYNEFYHFSENKLTTEEIYARQLCQYLVKDGKQYKLYANEMNDTHEVITLEEQGYATKFWDEKSYENLGINIEFRPFKSYGDMPLLSVKHVTNHYEAIRYLLKDVIDVPNHGQMLRDSTELDEDRKVYVIYVTEI